MKKYFVLFALPFLLYTCNEEEDDNNDNGQPLSNIVEVANDIETPTTWYADSVYLITAYDLWVVSSLTIQPGTVVKFSSNVGLVVSDEGAILANGTSSKPIVFTSVKDDSHGGDVNGDGSATSPSVADWENILVETNGSVFSYCEFYYGGSGSYLSVLEIYGSSASITHCLFVHNKGGKDGDFYYGALDVSNASLNTVVANNTFYLNTLPLSIDCAMSIGNTNTFFNPQNPSEGNTMNGIFTYNYDDIPAATSYTETEVPFVLSDNDLWIEASGSLTLASNVVIKFTSESALVVGMGGVLNQNATNAFTSFKDDSRGGDTNGDGSATSPSDGDWIGIYDDSGVVPYPHYYLWSNIHYDSY
ncbi:MAG: hypothetical protein IPM71_06365 [Bacteroidota bacterium]|nr:MAG: hypothetical protein IPM71_06365 [Bacteroidota bacterium]